MNNISLICFRKLQQEEEEANKKYLESLKQDELLAQEMQNEQTMTQNLPCIHSKTECLNTKTTITKAKLKTNKIDNYLSKMKVPPVEK